VGTGSLKRGKEAFMGIARSSESNLLGVNTQSRKSFARAFALKISGAQINALKHEFFMCGIPFDRENQ